MGLSQISVAIRLTKFKCSRNRVIKFLLENAALACVQKPHPHPCWEWGWSLTSVGFDLILIRPCQVSIIILISRRGNWVSEKEVPCHVTQLISSPALSTPDGSGCPWGRMVPIFIDTRAPPLSNYYLKSLIATGIIYRWHLWAMPLETFVDFQF